MFVPSNDVTELMIVQEADTKGELPDEPHVHPFQVPAVQFSPALMHAKSQQILEDVDNEQVVTLQSANDRDFEISPSGASRLKASTNSNNLERKLEPIGLSDISAISKGDYLDAKRKS